MFIRLSFVFALCFCAVQKSLQISAEKTSIRNWGTPIYTNSCPESTRDVFVYFKPPPSRFNISLMSIFLNSLKKEYLYSFSLTKDTQPVSGSDYVIHKIQATDAINCIDNFIIVIRGSKYRNGSLCLECSNSKTADACPVRLGSHVCYSSPLSQTSVNLKKCGLPREISSANVHVDCQRQDTAEKLSLGSQSIVIMALAGVTVFFIISAVIFLIYNNSKEEASKERFNCLRDVIIINMNSPKRQEALIGDILINSKRTGNIEEFIKSLTGGFYDKDVDCEEA